MNYYFKLELITEKIQARAKWLHRPVARKNCRIGIILKGKIEKFDYLINSQTPFPLLSTTPPRLFWACLCDTAWLSQKWTKFGRGCPAAHGVRDVLEEIGHGPKFIGKQLSRIQVFKKKSGWTPAPYEHEQLVQLSQCHSFFNVQLSQIELERCNRCDQSVEGETLVQPRRNFLLGHDPLQRKISLIYSSIL